MPADTGFSWDSAGNSSTFSGAGSPSVPSECPSSGSSGRPSSGSPGSSGGASSGGSGSAGALGKAVTRPGLPPAGGVSG